MDAYGYVDDRGNHMMCGYSFSFYGVDGTFKFDTLGVTWPELGASDSNRIGYKATLAMQSVQRTCRGTVTGEFGLKELSLLRYEVAEFRKGHIGSVVFGAEGSGFSVTLRHLPRYATPVFDWLVRYPSLDPLHPIDWKKRLPSAVQEERLPYAVVNAVVDCDLENLSTTIAEIDAVYRHLRSLPSQVK